MFTGIVEEVGEVISCHRASNSLKLRIGANAILEGTNIGDSIATNGVCLTVTLLGETFFEADVSSETLKSSLLSSLQKGAKVNLERAVALGKRLGGHILLGHIDASCQVLNITRLDDFFSIKLSFDSSVEKYIVHKGSVALDGVSLTVAEVEGSTFSVAVIPHTFNNTILKYLKQGSKMNLETDILARYVENLLKNDKKSDRLEALLKNLS